MKLTTPVAVIAIAVALALVLPFSMAEARWLEKPQPDLPFGVFYQGLQGSVVLSLVLDKSGRVTGTRVLKSSGHPALDELALAAARNWRLSKDSVLPTDLTSGRVELVTFRHESTPKMLLPGAEPYWAQLAR
jgi:TonB family protein